MAAGGENVVRKFPRAASPCIEPRIKVFYSLPIMKLFSSAVFRFAFALSLTCASLLSPPLTHAAAEKGTGLGIVLGDPSGLTVKHWLDSRAAIDGGLAYALNDFALLYGDYLYHFSFGAGSGGKDAEIRRFVSELRPYIGVGGMLLISTRSQRTQKAWFADAGASSSSIGLGLRFPLGMEWRPQGPPVGVFLELAPGIGVVPGTFGFLNAGLGARFYL